ncbi:DNA-binding protein, partial [Clostridium perfringens]
MTKASLLPDFHKCGGKGKERKGQGPEGKKRGRPRGNPSIYRGMNVNEDVKRIFKMALDKHYYSKNAPTLKWSYEQMIKEHFTTNHRIENGIKIPIIDLGSPIPSFGQFRYWFEKGRDLKKEVALRQGVKKYEQRYRPVLG